MTESAVDGAVEKEHADAHRCSQGRSRADATAHPAGRRQRTLPGGRGVTGLTAHRLHSVAVIGAHCEDIAVGAGATLLQIAQQHPDAVVHALVLAGGGTTREIEERNALASMCPALDVRLIVNDVPDGMFADHRDWVEECIAEFGLSCEPDVVFAPQRDDNYPDHRVVAELVATEFDEQLVLSYDILKWESDLPTPTVYLPIPPEVARRKTDLLRECYPSQAEHDWIDDEILLRLMRLRGVQCRSRYAEGFMVENAVRGANNLCSPN